MENPFKRMFGKGRGSEKDLPSWEVKSPSFKQLRAALPEELQAEYNQLSTELGKFMQRYGGLTEPGAISKDDMTPEDILKLERYDELTAIARKILEKPSESKEEGLGDEVSHEDGSSKD
jgi:hypothetical protein